jgi:hypothetical protein
MCGIEWRRPFVGGHDLELDARADHAERREHTSDLLLKRMSERAAGDGESDRHGHLVADDLDPANHVQLGYGPLELRVDHAGERLVHLLLGHGHMAEGSRSVRSDAR